jgi:hypothetical protein
MLLKNSQSFVSNDPGDPPLDVSGFENGYLTTEELCVLQLVKKELVTAVQHTFCTQFHLAGWFDAKLCVKCTSHGCYRLFFHRLQNTPTPVLGRGPD